MIRREQVEVHALTLAQRLVAIACQQLPDGDSETRHREWTAELPAIIEDGERLWVLRMTTLLTYSADQIRGAWLLRNENRRIRSAFELVGSTWDVLTGAMPTTIFRAFLRIATFYGSFILSGTASSFAIGGQIRSGAHPTDGWISAVSFAFGILVGFVPGRYAGNLPTIVMNTTCGGLIGFATGAASGAGVTGYSYAITVASLIVGGGIGAYCGLEWSTRRRNPTLLNILPGLVYSTGCGLLVGVADPWSTMAVVSSVSVLMVTGLLRRGHPSITSSRRRA